MIITIRIVDVEEGYSDFSAKEEVVNEKKLSRGISRLVSVLQEKIEKKQELATKTMGGYYARGIVPGWGQFYAERSLKGYIYSGAFIVTAAFCGYTVWDYMAKAQAYNDLEKGASEFDSKYDAKIKAADMAYIGIGTFALMYIVNWVDVLLLSKPDFGKKETVMDNKEIFIVLNITPHINLGKGKQYNLGYGIRF